MTTEAYAMECGTQEQNGLIFATGVQQDFSLGAWLVFPSTAVASYNVAHVGGSKPSNNPPHEIPLSQSLSQPLSVFLGIELHKFPTYTGFPRSFRL